MYYEVIASNNFEHLAIKFKQEQCSDYFMTYEHEMDFYEFGAYFLKAGCDKNESYHKSAAFGEKVLQENDERLKIALWNQIFPVAIKFMTERPFAYDSKYPRLSALLTEVTECAKKFKNNIGEGLSHDNQFETERLRLVPCDKKYQSTLIEYFVAHKDDLLILYNRPFSEKNIQFINRMYATDDDNLIRFSILDKSTDNMVGCTGVMFVGKVAYIEYIIFEEYRRAGYAFEAVNALISKLFNGDIYRCVNSVYKGKFEKKRAVPEVIKAEICRGNTPSENFVKRLGFNFDGVDRFAITKYDANGLPESQEDKLLYSLCKLE